MANLRSRLQLYNSESILIRFLVFEVSVILNGFSITRFEFNSYGGSLGSKLKLSVNLILGILFVISIYSILYKCYYEKFQKFDIPAFGVNKYFSCFHSNYYQQYFGLN